MKKTKILIPAILALFISCENSIITPEDYREKIIGNYEGLRVDTYWVDTSIGYEHDSSMIILKLSKSEADSIVDLTFEPPYTEEAFSFIYHSGQFTAVPGYHPPTLELNNDSLYFKHQPGLGPYWVECFTYKTSR